MAQRPGATATRHLAGYLTFESVAALEALQTLLALLTRKELQRARLGPAASYITARPLSSETVTDPSSLIYLPSPMADRALQGLPLVDL
jgi:hypothetical protein